MSTHSRINYGDVAPVSGMLHFLKDPLDSDRLGVTVAHCDPGWQSQPHDHSHDQDEEIYVLIEGDARVVIDDNPISMAAGDAIRIASEATRQRRNGDTESTFVLVSAASVLGGKIGTPIGTSTDSTADYQRLSVLYYWTSDTALP